LTLGYLGPEGTFSQQAARDYDGAARHVAYANIAAVMEAAAARSARMATRGINMVKIESRPVKRSLGRYVFLVDMEGHRTDPAVAEALEEMRTSATMFKVLGSYPKAEQPCARAGSGRAVAVG